MSDLIALMQPVALDPESFVGARAEVRVFDAETDAATRADVLGRASAVVTMPSDRVDEAFVARCPGLRIVANHAVGYDNVDIEACTGRGIWVSNTPDVLTEATADLTWALILSVTRRLREGERMVRGEAFTGWAPTMLLGMELHRATLGIFGLGRIGRAVLRRAKGFGMKVLATSSSSAPSSAEEVEWVPKHELLARSDVLTIHCPLKPETRHAFGAAELGAMKPHAVLINTARGPIVDEEALVTALEKGQIGGAGLDVYEREPRVHPGLLRRDDVVLLPHLGSATHWARRRMAELALTNALDVLGGRVPSNPVNQLR